MKRILSVILALAMLLAMVGCTQDPAPATTAAPETTVPGAEQFAQIYSDAVAKLEAAAAVTLDVKQTQSMQVESQLFVTEREQVVAYSGLGSDAVLIRMEENVHYSEEEDAEEDATSLYTEIYTDGTLYVELEESSTFRGALSAEEAALRYVPVALLDAALYGQITMEEADGLQKISFSAPTAAEAWAIPADAQMIEASGAAEITAEGAVSKLQYSVTYQYGPMEITRQVEATPRSEALEVTAPEDAESYTQLSYILALYDTLTAEDLLEAAETIFVDSSESYITYAGAAQYNIGSTYYMHGTGDDIITKTEQNIQFYSSEGSETYETEKIYQDGKTTVVTNGGLPTTQSGVKPKEAREDILQAVETSVAPPSYWEDVVLTEVSGKYLLEFTYNDDFGNNMQNMVCSLIFQDASLLNQHASAYENKEVTGYISLEKYTGLAVATGMFYEGVHTIDGEEFSLSMQGDKAYEVPCYGAYHEITEEYPEDPEPENKATPLLYKVTGADGQQMWLFGTIHVGDDRSAWLPQEFYDAVTGSDAIALEIDNSSVEERLEEDEKLAEKLADAWYYSDGTIEDHLEEATYKLAVQHMKAAGCYSHVADYMKVGIWQSALNQQYLRLGHSLQTEKGLEERLTKLAKENEIPIREVEDLAEHSNIDVNWSEDLQLLLLEEVLEMDVLESLQGVQEMYELWCAGDEAALREMVNEEIDTSEFTEEELAEYEAAKSLVEEYDQEMSYDRNELMLKKAQEYLESGDVVFFAVGLAHLLDDTNGLVDALRTAGYTVELVSYQ